MHTRDLLNFQIDHEYFLEVFQTLIFPWEDSEHVHVSKIFYLLNKNLKFLADCGHLILPVGYLSCSF
jgi:hypothetical protein